MKKYLFLLGVMFTLITSCVPEKEGIKDITVEDLKIVLKNDPTIQLIDVRTPEECAKGTIENAVEINVTSDNFLNMALHKLDKTKPVYLYCRSGGRSKIASQMLLEKGFQPYNILGGYKEWEAKNK